MTTKYRIIIFLFLTCGIIYIGLYLKQSSGKAPKAMHDAERISPASNVSRTMNESSTKAPTMHCNHKQAERKRTINKMCKEYKGPLNVAKGFQMVVDKEHKVLYCQVPKAGCTLMLQVLMASTSKGNKKHLLSEKVDVHVRGYLQSMGLSLLGNYKEKEQANILANYTKFLVVRHPVSRLISAYYNKLTGEDPAFEKTRQSVIARRANHTAKELKAGIPRFEEFVQALLDTKWSFRGDRHWQPMHSLCSPCAVHYDYVLKLESLEHDIKLFTNALATKEKPASYTNSLYGIKNKNNHQKQSPDAQPDIARELRNLTISEKMRVLDHFRLDMDLFGYHIDNKTDQMISDELTTC